MLAVLPQNSAPAAVITLLKASLLQVPSTTQPVSDGSDMTPIALNRPPVVWVLAFTRLELARRFASDARWCLELAGSDLIARLPENFGLHLNFGAGSECQIRPAEFSQREEQKGHSIWNKTHWNTRSRTDKPAKRQRKIFSEQLSSLRSLCRAGRKTVYCHL